MKELSKTNSSYGRWVVSYPTKDAFDHDTIAYKYFWRKKEAVEFLNFLTVLN